MSWKLWKVWDQQLGHPLCTLPPRMSYCSTEQLDGEMPCQRQVW